MCVGGQMWNSLCAVKPHVLSPKDENIFGTAKLSKDFLIQLMGRNDNTLWELIVKSNIYINFHNLTKCLYYHVSELSN